ncbi:MAG: sodium/solute symporter [Myxococcales bacterium FL481]|nr:MAG: sodium/solute symporter [Myxococcales bacterium FL481]
MGIADIVVFVLFVVSVISVGLVMSREEEGHGRKSAQDYFLAGRGLSWWLVGFSLIAANISTEQFVGMTGKAADWLGLAIASYEWMAAITLIVVAFVFLPTFLRSGIYTIPEFLEYRYNPFARTIMAISTMVIVVGVPTASVIFSGAKVITVFFEGQTLLGLDLGDMTIASWLIGIFAAIYVLTGGLKACAWADLIQGAALILGGLVIVYLAMGALEAADPVQLAATAANPDVSVDKLANSGALGRFFELNGGDLPQGKLHMVRPGDDPEIPWTALVVGLWIPNFFYWGLNQYITQRTLGSKSLAEGQRGVVFAAFLKLLIPFLVVVPGILAFNLFSGDLKTQADRKNAPVVEAFHAGSDDVFVFTDTFAGHYPELAQAMVTHNEARTGQTAEPIPVDGDPNRTGTRLRDANAKLVIHAEQQGVPLAQKLIGYDYDAAFPTLLANLLEPGFGLLGFVLAAIFGAVVSSLASMLNSASTIFAMDIFAKIRKDASQTELVRVGRVCVLVFVLLAIFIAPSLGAPQFGGIYTFIQEFQGFISPGILAIFLFGLLVPKAPRMVGTVGLILNPILYGTLKLAAPSVAFLDRMAICFFIVVAVLTTLTILRPLAQPVTLPVNEQMNMASPKAVRVAGVVVVGLTAVLYVVFW